MKKTVRIWALFLSLVLSLSVILPAFSAQTAFAAEDAQTAPAADAYEEEEAYPEDDAAIETQPEEDEALLKLPPLPEGYSFSGITSPGADGETLYYVVGEASEYGLVDGFWINAAGERVEIEELKTVAPNQEIAGKGGPRRAPALQTSYDARDEGLITPVKQQIGGTCWAFAATAAMEANLIKKGICSLEDADLSEFFIAWNGRNTYFPGVDDSRNDGVYYDNPEVSVLDAGGNFIYVRFAVNNFSGPVNESRYDLDTSSKEALEQSIRETLTFDERFKRDYTVHSIDMLEEDRDNIKQAILECGCVQASFFADEEKFSFLWGSEGNTSPCTYYYPTNNGTNHAINIIGWDDNFSADDFTQNTKPASDGAWLVRNSWGTRFGNDGYFWLSYEDKTLTNFVVYDMETVREYENTYFYDGYGADYTDVEGCEAANIFTAEADEYLTKVIPFRSPYSNVFIPSLFLMQQAFYNNEYTFEVYGNLPEDCDDPSAGTLLYTQSGPVPDRGYIEVEGDVDLHAGERFSVIFKNMERVFYEGKNSESLHISSHAHESYYKRTDTDSWMPFPYGNVGVRAITKRHAAGPYTVKYFCPQSGRYNKVIAENGVVPEITPPEGYRFYMSRNGEPFDPATAVPDRDITVNTHCFSTIGIIREDEPCVTRFPCLYCDMDGAPPIEHHSFTDIVYEKSEETPGYTQHICSVCGLYRIDNIIYNEDGFGGDIGGKFVWQICGNTLSVIGGGDLPDRTEYISSPWRFYADRIKRVFVSEGITSTGRYGFAGLYEMTDLHLPSTLQQIAFYAFSGANSLTELTLPCNLEEIQRGAFDNTYALEHISFNDCIKYIWSGAFTETLSLKEIVVPGTLNTVQEKIYGRCPSAERIIIGEGIKSLRESIYIPQSDDAEILEISIPSTVTYISSAFYWNFKSVKRFSVSEDNPSFCSVDGLLYNKDQTMLLRYPSAKDDVLFVVPETVTDFGFSVFSYTKYLRFLDLRQTHTTQLSKYMLYNTGSIECVALPQELDSVANWAISRADEKSALRRIYIPSTVANVLSEALSLAKGVTIYTDSEDAPIIANAIEYGVPYVVMNGHEHAFDSLAYFYTEPTCVTVGDGLYSCECGSFERLQQYGDHARTNMNLQPPTCVESGYSEYTCDLCGETYRTDITAPTGIHLFNDPVPCPEAVKREADCFNSAEYYFSCAVCGLVHQDNSETFTYGDPLGHDWDQGVITREPTCTAAGQKRISCQRCGASKTEAV
ncbi:MAG: leucine-rich repeat protein, partial [Clostridia bacterium]|nr:leucine-rich repeat protein [Clostridia bacterium]